MDGDLLKQTPNAHAGDALGVHMNRLMLLLISIFLLLVCAIAGDAIYGWPPVFQWDLDHVIGLVVLPLFGVLGFLGFIATFTPFPLLTIDHEGIRRYSIFGLFGTNLAPWSQVKAIVRKRTQYGQQIEITLAYPAMPRRGQGLIRHLIAYSWSPEIHLPKPLIAGSFDELCIQIRLRFGHELAEYKIEADLDLEADSEVEVDLDQP